MESKINISIKIFDIKIGGSILIKALVKVIVPQVFIRLFVFEQCQCVQ